jgi:pimeloyl-ACP methyl ester carboxylesterase
MPFCRIDDVKLYYEDYGPRDKDSLILLHGIMGNSKCWKPQAEHFKETRRVILFDLRGHGQSDKPRGKYSIRQFSEDLFAFMRSLEIERAIVAGHSMGGMVALRFTIDHQEMVDKLILLDTSAKPSFSFGRRLLLWVSIIAISISYETFVKLFITRSLSKSYSESFLKEALKTVLKTPKHVAKSCFSVIKDFDVTSELTDIQVPTLIIHGSEDTQQPLSQAKYLKENISTAELVVIEGAGHETVIEAPEKISEAIEEIIQM